MGIFGGGQKISTQDHLAIDDIRDDLVILKDGRISLLLETNALNFELLSEKEQDAKILAFASLMNSLDFQMQIVIKTERTDVSEYLDKLRAYRSQQISNALKKQIEIYMKFIDNLTSNREVLDKSFYVVIPEVIGEVQTTSALKQMFGRKQSILNKKTLLAKAKLKLYPKRDHLIKQFKKMGLTATQLNTESLIRLFYAMYDPDKLGVKNLDLSANAITSSLVDLKQKPQ